MFSVLGPTSSSVGNGMVSTLPSTSTSLCTALSPSSGYAEWHILPLALNTARSAPFEASARRLSVGSPLIRNRLPLAARFASLAPAESRSSPDTNNRPTFRPSARSTVAAATCAAMIPFASETPRPYMNSASSLKGMYGGTVSMCVENTRSGVWPSVPA